ncbi:aminodeoxychorismate synthase component I [Microcella alkaliphila]|uniref:aminodeoxychorismate synthase component I n=1 Tax=Microcella alkaliphila TaxID=279828 RepID=UPI000BBA8EE7|nr:aminodeoxychorismate synthase component I [Microcella alkaliphila]
MARGPRTVRVHRIDLGRIDDLEALAARVHADPRLFAIEGVEREASAADPLGVAWLDSGRDARHGRSVLAVGSRVALARGETLSGLRAALAAQRASLGAAGELPSPIGLVGWFGYELRDETMGATVPGVADAHRASWMRVDAALVRDHATGRGHVLALATDADAVAWAERVRALIDESAEHSPDEPLAQPARDVLWRDTDDHYAELVRRCLAAIRDGQAYQLCLTSAARVADPDEPITVYRRLRRSSPAHHGALITIGGVSLLSASPETFLTVADGQVTTRPIKGTRRRGADAASDAQLARELAEDDKERAENLMIVDLMRNDLQRVCEVGTVTVTGLHDVETYAHVHQLVSTVTGRLRPGLDALDAVGACFPAGSMTGAPKRRAVDLLAEWERAPRGIYSGAFGMLGADGSADLAMVIRSIVIADGVATVGAGGGITALSQPEAETEEMHLKARALLAALGAREGD